MLSRRSFLASSAVIAGATLLSRRALAGERDDWPQHGCGAAETRHNSGEAAIRPESVARLALRWDFEAGSGITGTPAVVGERVVVGSWDGRVYALERASGKRLWTFEAGTRGYPPDRRLGISASPAVSGGSVFVACDRLIALDLERGRVRWERVVGDPERSFEYFWAPPLVHGGRLYAGVSSGSETLTRGRIVCVDAATGRPLWTFFTVPAAVSGGAVIASPALDPRSGALYVATGNPFHLLAGNLAYSSSVTALDAATGALRWADQVHPHDTRNLDLNCPPMLLRDRGGKRLVVVGGKDGIRAWDRETRKRLWHVQLTPARPPAGGEALPTTGPEAGPTAAAGGLVFFASNNHADKGCAVAAIDAASGEIRWLHFLPAFQLGPLSVAGGVVFLGLTDGKLRAWSAAEGELLWESPAGPAIAGGPAIAHGMVFVGTGAGQFLPGRKLLAFALASRPASG